MLVLELLLMSMLVIISVLSCKQYNTAPTVVSTIVRRYSKLQRELACMAAVTPTYDGVVDECESTVDFCYATVEVSERDRVVLLDYLSVGIDV